MTLELGTTLRSTDASCRLTRRAALCKTHRHRTSMLTSGLAPQGSHSSIKIGTGRDRLHQVRGEVLCQESLWPSQLLIAVLIMSWPSWSQSVKANKTIVLDHAQLTLTPAALVFDQKGELYAGYRDNGGEKKSSAIWIRVFDPTSGKELRSLVARYRLQKRIVAPASFCVVFPLVANVRDYHIRSRINLVG
jgi:hypothetical protein